MDAKLLKKLLPTDLINFITHFATVLEIEEELVLKLILLVFLREFTKVNSTVDISKYLAIFKEYYTDKPPMEELSAKYDLHPVTLKQVLHGYNQPWLKQALLPSIKLNLTRSEIHWIVDQHNKGVSFSKLGDAVNLNRSTVADIYWGRSKYARILLHGGDSIIVSSLVHKSKGLFSVQIDYLLSHKLKLTFFWGETLVWSYRTTMAAINKKLKKQLYRKMTFNKYGLLVCQHKGRTKLVQRDYWVDTIFRQYQNRYIRGRFD